MDRIFIKDMIFFGYHGVFPEETKLGQKFLVQAVLHLDLAAAGQNDDLEQTVHYGEVFQLIRELVEGEPCKLLETVAERIADSILATYELVEKCEITLEKLNPPIPGHTGTVAIEIVREKCRHHATLSIGTNIGERQQHLRDAVAILSRNAHIDVIAVSSIYETDPVGLTEQDCFLNMAVTLRTALSPLELLDVCQGVEQQLGRKRVIRWGPRVIDVDILTYNEEHVDTPRLVVPHPQLHNRAFVLVPLAEIAGEQYVVTQGKTVADLLAACHDTSGVRKIAPLS